MTTQFPLISLKLFFSVPLHQDSKDFITFEYKSTRYSYNVLPFGLTSCRFFSKMLELVIVHLRSPGIKIFLYLDDIFICSSFSILPCLLALLQVLLSITTNLHLFHHKSFYISFTLGTQPQYLSPSPFRLIKIYDPSLLSSPITNRKISSFSAFL